MACPTSPPCPSQRPPPPPPPRLVRSVFWQYDRLRHGLVVSVVEAGEEETVGNRRSREYSASTPPRGPRYSLVESRHTTYRPRRLLFGGHHILEWRTSATELPCRSMILVGSRPHGVARGHWGRRRGSHVRPRAVVRYGVYVVAQSRGCRLQHRRSYSARDAVAGQVYVNVVPQQAARPNHK